MAKVQINDIKAHLGIDPLDTIDDALIVECIQATYAFLARVRPDHAGWDTNATPDEMWAIKLKTVELMQERGATDQDVADYGLIQYGREKSEVARILKLNRYHKGIAI